MTSIPVKDIGSVMSRNATSAGGGTQSAGSMSFETVWNNQTEKNSPSETTMSERKSGAKEEVDVRNSLKSKDMRKPVTERDNTVEKTGENNPENEDAKDWEKALEVLGTAAAQLIQQIADAFDMTTEEVQNLMTDLGMQQLDVLQQEELSNLLLAAGGAEDATSLLTNEELYQQYQTIMEQMHVQLAKSGEILQADAAQLAELAVESAGHKAKEETLPIEVTVENGFPVEEKLDFVQEKPSAEEDNYNPISTSDTVVEEAPNGERMQEQNQSRNSEQNQREELTGERTVEKQKATPDKAQTGNLLLQNLKAESLEPQLQQLSEATSSWDADTMDIMRQIMDYMKVQIKPDVSDVEMQLHPASLGTLQIHVAAKGGTVTAQFVTQNEAVKAALESQMIQLKESFAEQGVKVDAIEVTVQTHQFEQNLEQGRGRQQEETARKNRTRRIQLEGPLTMEDLNDMEEEEQLAAQMMATNGNTVDYTA